MTAPKEAREKPAPHVCHVCHQRDIPLGTRDGKPIFRKHDWPNGFRCEGSEEFVDAAPSPAESVEPPKWKYEICDYATGAAGTFCIARHYAIYMDFWNPPNNWAGSGYVFTDEKIARALVDAWNAAHETARLRAERDQKVDETCAEWIARVGIEEVERLLRLERDQADTRNEPPTCERCKDEYLLRDGTEPTKYCDSCAHERVSELEAERDQTLEIVEIPTTVDAAAKEVETWFAHDRPFTVRCARCGELMPLGPCDDTIVHVEPCKDCAEKAEAERGYWQTRAETAELKVLTFHEEIVKLGAACDGLRDALRVATEYINALCELLDTDFEPKALSDRIEESRQKWDRACTAWR